MKLTALIKQERFSSPAQESLLNVLATSSWLTSRLAAAMAPYGVTPAQYNVLRILRGSHPDRLTCSDIGERLLDRMPDVTRLLNRLAKAGLIERERAEHDRRVVEVGITAAGLDLLMEMTESVEAVERGLAARLSDDEHRQLCDLLERMRADQV